MTAPAPIDLSPRDIVRSGLCIGCGGCVGAGEVKAVMGFDRDGLLKPEGEPGVLGRPTERFARLCPFSPSAADEDAISAERLPDARRHDPHLGRFEAAFVGHARTADRARGSSGGLVTWTAAALLRSGRVDGVAHVAGDGRPGASQPMYAYRIARTVEDLHRGARSRYYPGEMSGVLREIRERPGRYAIVGVPCFIKAVHLLRAEDPVLRDRITHTLGLFCGHMKSARMGDSFAWQLGSRTSAVRRMDYRIKDPSRPANLYATEADLRSGETRRRDWWSLADGDWGAGFFQASACDMCDDVTSETADIAFGDAWAEPFTQDGRGTNVVVARSAELAGLLRQGVADGELSLQPVDAGFVVGTQAAGFRQRREGLAYRLTWARTGVRPVKRVAPARPADPKRRRIYRLRHAISVWSHRMMRAARALRWPALYVVWAQAALAAYHGLAYGRGRVGKVMRAWNRLLGRKETFGEGPA